MTRTNTGCANASEHCDDHTGLVTWMKGIASLLTLSTGLLGYSVFWQAPNIRLEIAKEIARLDRQDQDHVYRIQNVEGDVKTLKERVSALEVKR